MVIKLLAKNDLLDSKDWLKNTSHRQTYICAKALTVLVNIVEKRPDVQHHDTFQSFRSVSVKQITHFLTRSTYHRSNTKL